MSATGGHNALMAAMDDDRQAPALSDAAFAAELGDAASDFLLASWPLIDIARGDKRVRLRAAWLRLAQAQARRWLNDLRTPLPSGSRGVALSIHRAVLDLCRAHGLTSLDLIESLNAANEQTRPLRDDGLARLKALLVILIGEGLVKP